MMLKSKEVNFIYERVVIYVAFLCGLFPLMLFKIKPVIVIAFFILSLFSVSKRRKEVKIEIKKTAFFSILWMCYVVSLLFSENLNRGLMIVGRCIPMLLIPLAYTFLEQDIKIQFNKIFRKTFIVASSIFSLLMFFYLFQLGYFANKHDLYYCYSYITYEFWGFNDHPIYLSISFAIALFFILIDGFKSKILNFIFFIVLILGLLILARKGVIISFSILCLLLLILKKNKQQIVKMIVVFIVLFVLSLSVTEIRNRFLEIFDTNKIINNKETSSGVRYILWNTSVELIQKANYFGYGIGDVQNVLSKQLEQDGYAELAADNRNAHNQFIQIILAIGVTGIFLYLFSLVYFFKNFIKRDNIEGIIFLLFFLFLFLFESVLERQNGIIIYSFITCMFIFTSEFDKISKNAR